MSIDAYITARAIYVRVNASLDELSSLVSGVGRSLVQQRARFSFSNTGQGLPMEAMTSRDSVSADGNSWPTAQQIMEALAEWHQSKSNVQNTWGSLTADQKAALQPPPFDVGRR
jgi:hypothetical protein